jgi:hypothetical protein
MPEPIVITPNTKENTEDQGSFRTVKFDGSYTLRPGESIYSPNKKQELRMQKEDGILVLYRRNDDGSWKAVWESKTYGNAGAYAEFQGDGNLVVYDVGNPRKALWASKTDLTGTNNYGKGVFLMMTQCLSPSRRQIQTRQKNVLPISR